MKKTVCNMCGKEFDLWDEQEDFGISNPMIGYGSRYDGHRLNMHLCCDCVDQLIDRCVVHPTVDLDA